jgi:hypothetical protein
MPNRAQHYKTDSIRSLSRNQSRQDRNRNHIPASILWEHSRNPNTVIPFNVAHLSQCQDCVAVFIMCKTCASLEELRTRLTVYGIPVE